MLGIRGDRGWSIRFRILGVGFRARYPEFRIWGVGNYPIADEEQGILPSADSPAAAAPRVSDDLQVASPPSVPVE